MATPPEQLKRRLLLEPDRLDGWISRFEKRHGTARATVLAGQLRLDAEDGSWAELAAPYGRHLALPSAESLTSSLSAPDQWGMILARKGGFGIARIEGARLVESKVGKRHVQGRSAAGGTSQQRFARRRANQAQAAYDAAADYAVRIIGDREMLVVTGGDRVALDEVLSHPRLQRLQVVGERLDVPDPRQSVLLDAIIRAGWITVVVANAATGVSQG